MLLYKDRAELDLGAGAGGPGAVSFESSRRKIRGGPDGGDGGKGGDLILSPSSRYTDFSHFKDRFLFQAGRGEAGKSRLQSGAKGKDLTVFVPLGALMRERGAAGGAGRLLQSLEKEAPFIFLEGGRGGRGNSFYKSALNQAPSNFQKGLPGQQKHVALELKPLIDIAIAGRANTGKSSFFNFACGAKSPVADYPCATLKPYYGRLRPLERLNLPAVDKNALRQQLSKPYYGRLQPPEKLDLPPAGRQALSRKLAEQEARPRPAPLAPVALMDIPGLDGGPNSLPFLRLMGRAKAVLIFISAADERPDETLKSIALEFAQFDAALQEREFAFSNKRKLIVLSQADRLSSDLAEAKALSGLEKASASLFAAANAAAAGLPARGRGNADPHRLPPIALSLKTKEGLAPLLQQIIFSLMAS